MKFKKKPKPKFGDEKIIRKFAFLPMYSNNNCYWLQMVNVRYVFKRGRQSYMDYEDGYKIKCYNIWIEDGVVD